MRYHNAAGRPITFELLEHRFALDVGAELDVPREHAWLVAARQLPLAEGPSPLGAAAPRARVTPVAPAPRPRPVAVDDLADVDDEAPDDAAEGPADGDDGESELEASLAAAAANVGPRRPARPPARG
jgi:hypothetical protein